MPARDPLDDLLKEAKRHRHFENLRKAQALAREAVAKAKVKIEVQPPRPRYQLEAQGWYENRTIEVWERIGDTLTNRGVYIEHVHPTYGRHLVPCPSLDTSPNREEVGSWGEGRPGVEAYVETDEELSAIRNRFQSLLEEFDAGNQANERALDE